MGLRSHSLDTDLVPGPVDYSVLLPEEYHEDGDPYPLLLFLHGGNGDHNFLQQHRRLIERAWKQRLLPACVVATPSARNSFYVNYHDGSQRWETFLLEQLLPRLRRQFHVAEEREGTLLWGVSMGGIGALRLAFKYPERFAAVAALEPALEPGTHPADLRLRNHFYRAVRNYAAIHGSPVNVAHWQANQPLLLARDNGPAIQTSGLAIYLECGDRDCLNLYDGAEELHRLLFDAGIGHEYRLVRGADHIDASLPRRFLDGLGFLGRSLRRRLTPRRFESPLANRFHQDVYERQQATGYVAETTRFVAASAARLHVTLQGEGRPVVLLPSLGRSANDFEDLSLRLARAGHCVVRPQPRGIGASSGPLTGITLHGLAADIAAVIDDIELGPAVVVGHAFGNRVARTLASDRQDLVRGVVLMTAGGLVPIAPEVLQALAQSFNGFQATASRIEAIAKAFFAPGNDAGVWLDGWHAEVGFAQATANHATPIEEWWGGGQAPMLVLQGDHDVIAPPANGEHLRASYGERVELVTLTNAGHALLPEQPEAIAANILAWLDRMERP